MSIAIDDSVPSPCIKVCQLDASQTHCIACLRTLDEIAGWSNYDGEQKQVVWNRLNQLTKPATPAELKYCEKCGAQFACGANGKDSGCWCSELPQVLPLTLNGSGCLCPACLRAHMASEYRKRGMTPPF